MSEDLKHTPEILSAKDLQDMGFSRSMSYALFNREDIPVIHIIQTGGIMNRNVIMKFRATEEEAAEIRRKAAAAGMNVSRFLRTSAVKSQVALYNTADIYGLRSDIKRIGNNINQIAMAANSNRSVYLSDVRELRKQLNEMSGSVDEHLKPLSYEVL